MTGESPVIDALRKQLGGPRDGALLRYSLANALLAAADLAGAADAARQALEFDAHYSAAWKLLGQVHLDAGDAAAASAAWLHGIDVATARGDVQAAKEMTVFARRAQRQLDNG